jgi:hypothetical protein
MSAQGDTQGLDRAGNVARAETICHQILQGEHEWSQVGPQVMTCGEEPTALGRSVAMPSPLVPMISCSRRVGWPRISSELSLCSPTTSSRPPGAMKLVAATIPLPDRRPGNARPQLRMRQKRTNPTHTDDHSPFTRGETSTPHRVNRYRHRLCQSGGIRDEGSRGYSEPR